MYKPCISHLEGVPEPGRKNKRERCSLIDKSCQLVNSQDFQRSREKVSRDFFKTPLLSSHEILVGFFGGLFFLSRLIVNPYIHG